MEPNETQDWRSALPEDVRGARSLQSIKDVGHLARQYIAAEQYRQGVVKIPEAGAKPEVAEALLAQAWSKLGRPESPSDYGTGTGSGFEEAAFELGLSKKQVEGLAEHLGTYHQQQIEARDARELEAMEAATAQLKEEWADKYDHNLALAQRTVAMLGNDDIIEAITESGLGNNPAFIRLFADIGAMLVEDGIISDAFAVNDRYSEARQLLDSKDSAYWRHDAANHDRAVATVQAMFAAMYNGGNA